MATFVIDKGENYHISKTDTGYDITYSVSNKLFSQLISDLTSASQNIGFCDEKITLYDGKKLIRVRDALTLSEE